MPKGIIAILLYNRQLYLLICNKKSIFDKNNWKLLIGDFLGPVYGNLIFFEN